MVSVVDKDFAHGVGLEDWFAVSGSRVAFKDSIEVVNSDVLTLVVDLSRVVHILTVLLVEELTLDRVVISSRDIIITHVDDLVLRDAILAKELTGMSCIGLMAVVPEAFGASDHYSPVVFGP